MPLDASASVGGEPPPSYWADAASYGSVIEEEFAHPLREAIERHGFVPDGLVSQVLQRLRWYFIVDSRERAPTMKLRVEQAPEFHSALTRVMSLLASAVIELPEDGPPAEVEAVHALKSYTGFIGYTRPRIDHYDHDAGLCRITYYVHGEPPDETVCIDGRPTEPAFAKYRGCRFFHRLLFRQRIAWFPIAEAQTLVMNLDGRAVDLGWGNAFQTASSVGRSGRSAGESLDEVRRHFAQGKGGRKYTRGLLALKAASLKVLARFPLVRSRFRHAWVFIDREEDTDDNAEHLYRWVRQNHPEINAWFLLRPGTPAWRRLHAEGFRLIGPGLVRKLLILNSEHVMSSHADYVFGGMDRFLYGDAMGWKATFLQHGVIYNDLSHWLGPREFDCFITTSPAEELSISGDDSPYPYTRREVVRTGLPRHDRLLSLARARDESERPMVVVMPTWRGSLVDERTASRNRAEQLQAVMSSRYATQWRAFLGSDRLKDLLLRHDHTLVFLPHANAIPFLDAFALAPHVILADARTQSLQYWLARCSSFVTDYTSVAFDVALLRRGIFYYQFDREEFFGGGHNWRPGYFDYDRDGFGPVARTADELVNDLAAHLEGGCKVEDKYLERMKHALPDQDEGSCERVFNAILSTRRRWSGSAQAARRVS